MKAKALFLLLLAPILFTGCSTIMDGGRTKTVQINSNPEGAKVTITDVRGIEICVKTTPATVSLDRWASWQFAEDYKLHFDAPGYYPYETHVKSTYDGWYVVNFICLDIIGLIIDDDTGDCYTLSPPTVNCTLIPSSTPLTADELKTAELKANTPADSSPPPGGHKP